MLNQFLKLLPWTKDPASKDDAKRRLKVVIAHDRVGLTPEIMEAMRKEILGVIARYVEVDLDDMEFFLENDNRLTALTANFPIKKLNLEALPTEPVQSGPAKLKLDDVEDNTPSPEQSESPQPQEPKTENSSLDKSSEVVTGKEDNIAEAVDTSKDLEQSSPSTEPEEKSSTEKPDRQPQAEKSSPDSNTSTDER